MKGLRQRGPQLTSSHAQAQAPLYHHRRPEWGGPCFAVAASRRRRKTTFAREFLPKDAGVLHFVNADLIAAGLSPLYPPAAQIAAARIFMEELDRLAAARADFAFETTLSGRTYLERLRCWRADGYRIELVFLKLGNVELALRRVALRVKQGGHHVPEVDVKRRFIRGWRNFVSVYRSAVDAWSVYDNEQSVPVLIEESNG